MTRLIRSLSDISSRYDALFCDLWGCVHNGKLAYPAAIAALRAYRASGGTVVLLTNAPRPWDEVVVGFDRLGIPPDAYDLVVSSGDAAAEALAAGMVGTQVYHIGPAKDDGLFRLAPAVEKVALTDAQGIVCSGPFHEDTETPADYRGSFLLAQSMGLKMLCANPDLVVDLGDRRIYCAGALAQLYEQMGGQALYFGKPHSPIYQLARNRMADPGIADDRILCIGDGIGTDVAGGMAEGLDTLFVTGGLAAAEFGSDPDKPDPGRLQIWLDGQSLSPTAAIGRLR